MMWHLFRCVTVVSFLLLLTLEALAPRGPEFMTVECGHRSVPPVNALSRVSPGPSASGLAKTARSQVFIGVVTNATDAVIRGVLEGSPAAKAGLRTGDVVLDIVGYPVHTGADLWIGLQHALAGTNISIRFVRNEDVLERCLVTEAAGSFAKEQ